METKFGECGQGDLNLVGARPVTSFLEHAASTPFARILPVIHSRSSGDSQQCYPIPTTCYHNVWTLFLFTPDRTSPPLGWVERLADLFLYLPTCTIPPHSIAPIDLNAQSSPIDSTYTYIWTFQFTIHTHVPFLLFSSLGFPEFVVLSVPTSTVYRRVSGVKEGAASVVVMGPRADVEEVNGLQSEKGRNFRSCRGTLSPFPSRSLRRSWYLLGLTASKGCL